MLPQWDPNRLISKIPMNVALIGGRRMGKTSASSDIIERTAKHWDLVIAFIGSAACNPVLETQMRVHNWDPRFFFSEYKDDLMTKLLQQQQELKKDGRIRRVLVIVDDVILQGKCKDSLANLGIRGRHFFVSIFMCCVSYTTCPKRLRRSLDCLLVFSLPMSGDLQVLTWEFASKVKMARFALDNLQKHQCLVLEKFDSNQKLYVYTAPLLSLVDRDESRKTRATDPGESGRNPSTAKSSGCPEPSRQKDTFSASSRTLFLDESDEETSAQT